MSAENGGVLEVGSKCPVGRAESMTQTEPALTIAGEIYGMGEMVWPNSPPSTNYGFVIERPDRRLIHVTGLTYEEMKAMPSILFRGAVLTLTPNAQAHLPTRPEPDHE